MLLLLLYSNGRSIQRNIEIYKQYVCIHRKVNGLCCTQRARRLFRYSFFCLISHPLLQFMLHGH